MVTLPSVPLKVQVAPPGQLIRETLRGLSVRSNVRIRCVGAAKVLKIPIASTVPSATKNWVKDAVAPKNVHSAPDLRASTEAGAV